MTDLQKNEFELYHLQCKTRIQGDSLFIKYSPGGSLAKGVANLK